MKISDKAFVFAAGLVFSLSSFAGIDAESWKLKEGRKHNSFVPGNNIKLMEAEVFSEATPFQQRWKLVSEVAGLKTPLKAKSFLKRCLESNKWFLQSAALKVLKAKDPELALTYANKLLLKGKSLVVRSEAVDIISSLGGPEDTKPLWSALRAPQNFRRSQSLWIRPQIVKAIHKLERSNHSEKDWSPLLTDSDLKVKEMAKRVVKTY